MHCLETKIGYKYILCKKDGEKVHFTILNMHDNIRNIDKNT